MHDYVPCDRSVEQWHLEKREKAGLQKVLVIRLRPDWLVGCRDQNSLVQIEALHGLCAVLDPLNVSKPHELLTNVINMAAA